MNYLNKPNGDFDRIALYVLFGIMLLAAALASAQPSEFKNVYEIQSLKATDIVDNINKTVTIADPLPMNVPDSYFSTVSGQINLMKE